MSSLRTYISDSTVTLLRRLRPYSIREGSHNFDPYVSEIISHCYDSDTITSLDQYTRGMYDLELHYNSFNQFSHPILEERSLAEKFNADPAFELAIAAVNEDLNCIGPLSMIPSDQLDSVKYVPSSAAGYGYYGLKRDNYHLARRNATRAIYDYRRYQSMYRYVPDKAFARSQLALRANPKIRHVWGRSFHNILIESLSGQPLVEKMLLYDVPIYIGKDLHKDLPYTIARMLRDEGQFCYCLDFSAFDSSLCGWLIDAAWNVVRRLFVFKDSFERLNFEYAERLFKNTPIVMPDGRLYLVQCGVPSGSFYTQIIDSICNLIIIYALQYHFTGRKYTTYVLGDDSIFALPSDSPTLEQITDYLSQYRLTINAEKSVITRNYSDIIFLGHNFYGSRVTRDELTCLSLAMFTEDPVSTPAQSAVRVASLLYDSGFNSFGLFNIYKELLFRHKIIWNKEIARPADVLHPYYHLFTIS